MNTNKIAHIAEQFTNGTPINEEVDLTPDKSYEITFSFDNPFEEDLEEYFVVASILVDVDAYDDFSPDSQYDLHEVRELDSINDEIVNCLRSNGFEEVYGPEYDEANSTDSYHTFVYTLIL